MEFLPLIDSDEDMKIICGEMAYCLPEDRNFLPTTHMVGTTCL